MNNKCYQDTGHILVLTLCLCVLPVHAKTYKWIDINGGTHYSQTPPDGTPSEEIESSVHIPKKSSATPPAPDSTQPSNASALDKANEKIRKENCITEKHNLMVLENNHHVRVNEDGKYRVLAQEERKARIDKLKQQLSELCP